MKELLDSGKFEPDECRRPRRARLPRRRVAAVERAKVRKRAETRARREQSRDLARRGHLLRFGVLWLVVGLGFTIAYGAGLISYLVVIGVGATLVLAGTRSIKRAQIPRRDY